MNIFDKLKRIFSTGLIVSDVKNKSIKVIDTQRSQAYKQKNSFISKLKRNNNYGSAGMSQNYIINRLALYRDYDMMDADPVLSCLAGDTRVMTLDKIQTMLLLTERYKDGQEFLVWCWDNLKCKYTIGNAHHPRKMGIKPVILVYFDNGKMLKCTKDHKILLSDGTYKLAQYLTLSDSLRSFLYQNKEYMMINLANTSKYTKAHQYIYKHVLNKHKKGMHIHHLDHNKYNNSTKNLIQLTPETHIQYHGISIKTRNDIKAGWTKEKRLQASIRSTNMFKCPLFLLKFRKKMKLFSNTPHRKKQLSDITKGLFKNPIYKEKAIAGMAKISSNHCKKLWKKLDFKLKLVQKRLENLELKVANDPNYHKKIKNIPTLKILLLGIKYNNLKLFSLNFDSGIIGYPAENARKLISRRLKKCGYKNFTDYKNNYLYLNHKVVKIIDNNLSIEVYDLTVDYYLNFCLLNLIIVSNSALDIYVFEALTKDLFGDILKIKSLSKLILDVLTLLFYQRLNCLFNFSIWFRNFVKYGDFPLALKLSLEHGIIGALPISPYDFLRILDDNDNPLGYYFKTTGVNLLILNYNIAHFRLLRDTNFLPYGKSVLLPARRTWKSLTLMIDAMMIQRIMRAPERRVFKIDTGNLSEELILPYMNDIINSMKKVPYKDPKTGLINLKYNMQNILEDYYFPVKGPNDGSSVLTLPGVENSMMLDILFIKGYMLAALKIPKAFLGYLLGILSKATLASLDIIFARYILDLQKIFTNLLYRIALIHLTILGYTDIEDINFLLSLNNPSDVKKLQLLLVWSRKVQLAKLMELSGHFSYNYIYSKIYLMGLKLSIEMLKQVISDTRYRKHLADILTGLLLSEDNLNLFDNDYDETDDETSFLGNVPKDYVNAGENQLDTYNDNSPLNNDFLGNTPLNMD